jgi:lipopolysaccharide/colanic/teichoic acid biosynthesis glycosyltransferase
MPLVTLPRPHLSGSSRFLKRSFDIAADATRLVLLSPVFVAIAVLIKLDSRGRSSSARSEWGPAAEPSASSSSER